MDIEKIRSSHAPVPAWMSQEAITTLSKGYLLPGETPRDLFLRVAAGVEKYIPEPGLGEDIFDILYRGYLGLATPVASNFNTPRGLPVSCFAVTVDDSVNSIYSHLKECAQMSKQGGGVACSFDKIRPAGAAISGGGKSTGVVPWMKQYDISSATVSQGNTRRGSYAMYLPIDHPDLPELLLTKDHSQGDPRMFIDSNIAVTVTDAWIESMLDGDEEKKKLFGEVLKLRMISGSPYIIYIDNVNNQNPQAYKERGLKVSTSNLCLDGETLVATDRGLLSMKELFEKYQSDEEITVYSRDLETGDVTLQSAKAIYNGKKQFIKVKLSDNTELRCTPDHRLATLDARWVEAKDSLGETLLGVGMPLEDSPMVMDISPLSSYYTDVYDLSVEHNHNFYAITNPETYSGVLVHNCSEITLYTDENHSFVCVLSSMNLLRWNDWKNYYSPNKRMTAPQLAIYLLDAVCEEFIQKGSKTTSMGRAVRFAKKSRALGLGTLGLAALYQSLNLPFASDAARALNIEIHKFIDTEAKKASEKLAHDYGQPEWCQGTPYRHTHLSALAPTRTNAVISGGLSQGIEPLESNIYVAKQAKGTFVRKNPFLEKVLDRHGKNTDSIWNAMISTQGSVQEFDFLSDHEREVFRTAREIDQFELLRQAADRQKYICQAQSLNLFVDSECTAEYLFRLHLTAWKLGLKSLYYLRSNSAQVMREKTNEIIIVSKDNCPYCQKAKEYLFIHGLVYKEISKDKAIEKNLWSDSHGTFPQIYFSGTFIGGYDQLMEFFSESDRSSECVACEG